MVNSTLNVCQDYHLSNYRFFFCLDQYYLNNTDFTYNMSAVNGVFYTTVAVTILFSLASLFGVIGSITVSNPHDIYAHKWWS